MILEMPNLRSVAGLVQVILWLIICLSNVLSL